METPESQQRPVARKAESQLLGLEQPIRCAFALDPFGLDGPRIEAMQWAATAFAGGRPVEISPAGVLYPKPSRTAGTAETFWSQLEETRRTSLDESLHALGARSENLSLAPATILTEPSRSKRSAAACLAKWAAAHGAEILVVNTHGATAIERLRLGSFAEALLATSTVPVLALGPKCNPTSPTPIRTILVPTDFSERAEPHLGRAIALCKRLGAKLVLHHVFEPPTPPPTATEMGIGFDNLWFQETWKESEERQRGLAGEWARIGEGEGIATETIFDAAQGDVPSKILAATEASGADLVAMPSFRGPIGQALLGSVARDVVQGSERPVLVIHSESH